MENTIVENTTETVKSSKGESKYQEQSRNTQEILVECNTMTDKSIQHNEENSNSEVELRSEIKRLDRPEKSSSNDTRMTNNEKPNEADKPRENSSQEKGTSDDYVEKQKKGTIIDTKLRESKRSQEGSSNDKSETPNDTETKKDNLDKLHDGEEAKVKNELNSSCEEKRSDKEIRHSEIKPTNEGKSVNQLHKSSSIDYKTVDIGNPIETCTVKQQDILSKEKSMVITGTTHSEIPQDISSKDNSEIADGTQTDSGGNNVKGKQEESHNDRETIKKNAPDDGFENNSDTFTYLDPNSSSHELHEEHLSSKEEENKHLYRQLEANHQEITAYKCKLQEMNTRQEEVEDLRRQIKQVHKEKEKYRENLAERNCDNADILAQFLQKKKSEEKLKAELAKMREESQNIEKSREEVSEQLNKRTKELSTLRPRHKHEMEKLKANFKAEKEKMNQENDKLRNEMKKDKENVKTMECENKDIKDECENLKSELTRITRDLEAAKKECSEMSILKADINAKSTVIMELKAALDVKEAEKKIANECMQKAVKEQQEMMYSLGNLWRMKLEKENLQRHNQVLLEQNTKFQASLQEYGLLRDHIQEYYKAVEESKMELEKEKEKGRRINELFSKTGNRLDSLLAELQSNRSLADNYRRLLEEEKDKYNRMEREMNRLTTFNEKLTEERDKYNQKCFEYRDKCRCLREELEKSQAESTKTVSQTQEGATDGTTISPQDFQNPNIPSISPFVFGARK